MVKADLVHSRLAIDAATLLGSGILTCIELVAVETLEP